jgi:hypothetical protein
MYNVVVANFPIGPRYNGGAMTVWGILNALYDKNEKVIIGCLQNLRKCSDKAGYL